MRATGRISFWVSIIGTLFSASAQGAAGVLDTKTTSITRVDTPPAIDGRLDDAAWREAVLVDDLHQVHPEEYSEPSQRTEFRLLYDANAIYIGVRAFESDPNRITAKILRQGKGLRDDDRARVLLSPFNDKRSGYSFLVNANGVRIEGIYLDNDFGRDWTGIWQAASAIDDEGWTSELRIPFKTLSFNSEQDWGINFSREIVRNQENIAWVSRNRSVDPAIVGTLTGMSNLSQGRGLDIVSAVSVTRSHVNATNSSDTQTEPSIDLFYKVTPGLNASMTLNTDFSATEVDSRQVNLTRFNLFFPEKRAFFLRESDIFEFGGIGGDDDNETFSRADKENGRPYFSRRIGLGRSGQLADLKVGAKLSGRIGRWNLGVQAIRQDGYDDVDGRVDPTDLFVTRVSANVLEESNVGLIATKGDPRSNLDNSLVGFDYVYRNSRMASGRSMNAGIWYQHTDTEGLSGDDSSYGAFLSFPNLTKWYGDVAFKEIQENFYPAVGFISRAGIQQYSANMGYRHQHNGERIRSFIARVDTQRIDLIDGGLQSQSTYFSPLELHSNGDDRIFLAWRAEKEVLAGGFEISDGIDIPAGSYSFGSGEIGFETGGQRVFSFGASYQDGDFFDGTIRSYRGEMGWRPAKHFQVEVEFQVDNVKLPQGDFVARLISTEFDIVFSNTWSWVNLIQYDNVSETIGLNSRLHWAPQAGRNVYLVINRNYRERLGDRGFSTTNTDVSFKVDYTFRF